ncbi:MAG: FlgO family outer membrane protein [Magnetococcus sp. YQC-5]
MITPKVGTPHHAPIAVLLTLVMTTVLASGCVTSSEPYPLVSAPLASVSEVELTEVTHLAADSMIHDLGDKLHQREVILPASFVNENHMDQTSPLGRLLAKQMASRFTQAGHSIVEIALRKEILLKKDVGQFALSQELKEIRKTHKVSAILAGNYVTARNRIFINAQLIRTQDGVVLASNDFSLPLTPNLRALLLK